MLVKKAKMAKVTCTIDLALLITTKPSRLFRIHALVITKYKKDNKALTPYFFRLKKSNLIFNIFLIFFLIF